MADQSAPPLRSCWPKSLISDRQYCWFLLILLSPPALLLACYYCNNTNEGRWEYHTLSGRHWDYHAISARWEHHTLSAACWEHYTLSAACWEYDILSVAQPTNTQAQRVNNVLCLKIANKYIVKTIIFSSFNNIDLLCSMLANCCMQRCRGEGTMAAIRQRWPPW